MSARAEAGDVTRLLGALEGGAADDSGTRDALYREVYGELHRIAHRHRGRWRGNLTLNTTAVVHEAYVKLAAGSGYENRRHFLAVASRAMRQVLYTYAERQAAGRRGGGAPRVSLDEAALVAPERADDVVALERALRRLERRDPRAARVVECRFYGGLEAEETAEALGVSLRTVARDWAAARAWLYGELRRSEGAP